MEIDEHIEFIADIRTRGAGSTTANGIAGSVIKCVSSRVEPEMVILQLQIDVVRWIEGYVCIEIVDVLTADLIDPAEVIMPERKELVEGRACTPVRVMGAARVVVVNPEGGIEDSVRKVVTQSSSAHSRNDVF